MEIFDDGRLGLDSDVEATAIAVFSGVVNAGHMSTSDQRQAMFKNGLSFTPGSSTPGDEIKFIEQADQDHRGGYKSRSKLLPEELIEPGQLIASKDIAFRAIQRMEELQLAEQHNGQLKKISTYILHIVSANPIYGVIDPLAEDEEIIARDMRVKAAS